MPTLNVESEMSKFNSTQDTTWFKPGQQNKKGMEGRSVPPHFGYHKRNAANSKNNSGVGHFDGGVQTVDPMISFGRAIGPGNSLQLRLGSNNKK